MTKYNKKGAKKLKEALVGKDEEKEVGMGQKFLDLFSTEDRAEKMKKEAKKKKPRYKRKKK